MRPDRCQCAEPADRLHGDKAIDRFGTFLPFARDCVERQFLSGADIQRSTSRHRKMTSGPKSCGRRVRQMISEDALGFEYVGIMCLMTMKEGNPDDRH